MVSATIYPNAAGTETELFPSIAPNWDCVNDALDVSDYVLLQSDLVAPGTASDLYNTLNGQVPPTAIISDVTIYIHVRKVQVAIKTATARTRIKVSGFAARNGLLNTLTTSWTTKNTSYVVNPDSGVAWTPGDIDGLEIGVYLTTAIDITGDLQAQCASVYIIVTYTLPAGTVLRRLLVGVGL